MLRILQLETGWWTFPFLPFSHKLKRCLVKLSGACFLPNTSGIKIYKVVLWDTNKVIQFFGESADKIVVFALNCEGRLETVALYGDSEQAE